MQGTASRAAHVLRNAFFSPGARRFGRIPFARDYLRFAAHAAGHWEDRGAGTITFLGHRISFLDHKVVLGALHGIFVAGEYAFRAGRPDPFILDCGANIGIATLYFKTAYPRARVLSFEPHPASFDVLRRNVEDNRLAGVELRQAAVGDRDGTLTLYDSPDEEAALNVSFDAGWVGGREFTAPVERLSDRIDGPVDFLKLNVEGAEYAVVDDLVATGAFREVREAVVCWHAVTGVDDGERRMTETLRAAGMEVTPISCDEAGRTGALRAVRRA